jgi:hypothetical protein
VGYRTSHSPSVSINTSGQELNWSQRWWSNTMAALLSVKPATRVPDFPPPITFSNTNTSDNNKYKNKIKNVSEAWLSGLKDPPVRGSASCTALSRTFWTAKPSILDRSPLPVNIRKYGRCCDESTHWNGIPRSLQIARRSPACWGQRQGGLD